MLFDTLPTGIVRTRSKPQSQDVTSFDSSAVFLVKALFYPVTAVAFFVCACGWESARLPVLTF